MSIVLGTNSGFITTSPTTDPAGTNFNIANVALVVKDTSPSTATKITEVGWWSDTATTTNFEIGLYSANGTGGSAGTRLQAVQTNSTGGTAGWKKVTVDWTISASTVYWIAVQVDTATPGPNTNYTNDAGNTGVRDNVTATTLPSPWTDLNQYTDIDFALYAVWKTAPTVTTEAVSAITSTTATGNGTVTDDGGATITERGVCIGASANPTTGDTKFTTGGTTGAYTVSMTGLPRNTHYHLRAYATNSIGTSYGADVEFTTLGFTNPGNIYSSNNSYTTLAATSGILTVEVSKDAGVNWQTPKTVTFTASDTLQTVGLGATELFGSSFTRADMVDANLRIRLSQGNISQVYKTFGFTTGSDILTGIEIAIEGNYTSPTMSLDLLEVRIYYGNSVLPVQAGSQAYASNGRKAGEGAGSGTGVLVFYDSSNWIACDTGATVAA